MYDKFGIILRIECAVNDISQFCHIREVKHLHPLCTFRHTQGGQPQVFGVISTFDDPIYDLKKLNKISRAVEADDCTYRGFKLFDEDDSKLFEIIARGEFNIKGIRNKDIQLCWRLFSGFFI